MTKRSFEDCRDHVERAKLKKPPSARFSEREHAVQRALTFWLMVAITVVLVVGAWLLR